MKKHLFLTQITTSVAVALLALTSAADNDTAKINGRFAGQSTVVPLSETDLVFRQENLGLGHISHLGRVRSEWVVREVRFDTNYAQLLVSQPEWTGTITTAQGDQIFGTYRFRANALPVSASGEVVFTTDLIITGGTGRFENAAGQAEAKGRGNVWTRKFEIELEGEISGIRRQAR